MSSTIRARPDWIEVIKDADTRAGWATEAKAKGVTDLELSYALDELEFYASLHSPDSNIRLSAADGVWLSDKLIDAETTKELRDYAAILESIPDSQKDWHPESRSRTLNLIDPSLYPLVYDCSWLHRQPIASPQAALNLDTLGEQPGSVYTWCGDLSGKGDGQPKYHIALADHRKASYSSTKFSWLPSEFRVDDSGAVTIESYINNLHPVRHAALYSTIASVFSKLLPLLGQVLTDLVHPRKTGVELDLDRCFEYDGPKPDVGRNPYTTFCMELKRWMDRAKYLVPTPEPFVIPERPVKPYDLCGRRLQAVVQMSSIELLSKKPTYGGKGWSVAGLDNECIIATGIFFFDVVNIAPCSLRFREPFNAYREARTRNSFRAIKNAYGVRGGYSERLARASQELGSVDIKDRLCVVFPNTYQYKLPRITRQIGSKPGHCKMLTFYFVDPSTRIPSTELVPPQQRDWWMEQVLTSEPLCKLPLLVVEGIMSKIDSPISLKCAKQTRLEMEAEVKKMTAKASLKFFEPINTVECSGRFS
ncbi:hypothetical protein H4218_005727 [Coemansia sp. IMI 209128]|nr:hypothetical protein H4218_005727 [Coemansia sp. IMI 209128]